MVEVTDGRDLRALVVGKVDGEGLFCTEDDFYEVKANGSLSSMKMAY